LEEFKNKLKEDRYEQNTKERNKLATLVKVIVSLWLLFAATMFILYGVGCLKFPSEVMCTLLATTTANVLGLGYILLKGIFPENKNK